MLPTLNNFAEACNNNARLRKMNHDWTRTIAILPTDSAERYWMTSQSGTIEAGRGAVDNADLQITAQAEIIRAIFSGQTSPTAPYNAGDLLVKGSQDDLMRLDIITLLIWGE